MNVASLEENKPKQRVSWSLTAELASLDLPDDDGSHDDLYDERSVPEIYHRSSSQDNTRKTAEITKMLMGNEDFSDEINSVDLKSHSRIADAQSQRSGGLFSSFSKNKARNKKVPPSSSTDPLMAFLEKRSYAHDEYKKQKEASRRKSQLRDFDDDKSVSSSNSFFDFFTKVEAADELYDDRTVESEKNQGIRSSISIASMLSLYDSLVDGATVAPIPKEPNTKKETCTLETAVRKSDSINGSKVYKRGKRSADKGDWKKAVAYYHIALVKQREYYGEDHVRTAATLNALGEALMHLGELYGAMTALEEALHIRQILLGSGDQAVAETTNNIWLVLKASQDAQETDSVYNSLSIR